MFSIIEVTKHISESLQKAFNNINFRWKGNESPDQYIEVKPVVEAFTFEDVTEDGYPVKTPSILVQPVTESAGEWHFVLFLCCSHPAIQDKEITKEVSDGVYEYKTGKGYTSIGCRKELIKFGLLLAEQTALFVNRFANDNRSLRISNVTLNAPSPILPEFPYATSTIEFDCSVSRVPDRINTDLAALL